MSDAFPKISVFFLLGIPAGLTYTLGSMTGKRRHSWAVFWAMSLPFLAGVSVTAWAEAGATLST